MASPTPPLPSDTPEPLATLTSLSLETPTETLPPTNTPHPDIAPTLPHLPEVHFIYNGDRSKPYVALTFDLCQKPEYPAWFDRKIYDVLLHYNIPATFFMGGDWMRTHTDETLLLAANPLFEMGNHSWDHPDLARLDYHQCTDQLARTSSIIERTYGVRPTLFRPPYGHLAGSTLLAAAESGLTTVLWSAQPNEDRFRDNPAGLVTSLRQAARPGSIFLLHDTGPSDRLVTIDNLEAIITGLKADGFAFSTVSELCGLR